MSFASATTMHSGFKMDRLDILDNDVAFQLNTYRNWGDVDLMIDPFPADGEGSDGGYAITGTAKDGKPGVTVPAKGTKALFNNVHGVYYSSTLRRRNNMPMIDTKENRELLRNEGDCTIKSLVENSGKGRLGRAVYTYADFMYCKELGRVSNNYLVTLRRFPSPCGDTVLFVDPDNPAETDPEEGLQQHAPDVGRMVTWMGVSGNEMGNILKYNYKMPFREVNSEIQEFSGGGDDSSAGPLGALLNGTSKQYRQYMIDGRGGDHSARYVGQLLEGRHPKLGAFIGSNGGGATYSNASWRGFRDRNKVYGNFDLIKKTTLRGYDGLDFNQSITLTFDYELRSYDGINTKAAFLDLLANILTVTYTTGTFWGGGYRMTSGSPQSNVFANLPIFKMAQKGQLNSVGDLYDGVVNSLESIWGQISQGEGILGAIKNLGSSLFSMFTGAALNALGRPTRVALNSLLTPAPTGLWHLTIGNPMHPIMVIGNLILDNTEIEHYGPLGLDDFPTGLRVTCTLHHGKPRDTSLIENMYVLGHSRVYIPIGTEIDKLYESASEVHQSKNSGRRGTRQNAWEKYLKFNGSDIDGGINKAWNGAEYVVKHPKETLDSIKGEGKAAWAKIKNFGTTSYRSIMNAAMEVGYGAQQADTKNSGSKSTGNGKGGKASV